MSSTESSELSAAGRGISYLYLAAAFVIVVSGLRAAEAIVNPLLLAIFLSIISAPAYFGLLARGFSNWLSLLIVIGVLTFVVVGVVFVVMESIAGFTSNQEHYKDRLAEESRKLQLQFDRFMPNWAEPASDQKSNDPTNTTDLLPSNRNSDDGTGQAVVLVNRTADNDSKRPPAVPATVEPSENESADGSARIASELSIEADAEKNDSASNTAAADADISDSRLESEPETEDVETHRPPKAINFATPRGDLPTTEQSWRDYMSEQFSPGTLISLSAGIVGSIGQLLSNTFLILLTVIFILLEAGSFNRKMKDAFSHTDEAGQRAQQIIESIHQYIVIKSWVSLATGLMIALWLKFLGVPYAYLWGLLAFLFNFVPNVGSIIAAIPAVLIAWLDLTVMPAIACGVGFLIVNIVVGNFIEPRVMGRGLGLSPLVVFCSMVFWGWVLGPVGMLLSVPLTMTARIVFDGFEDTKWIATLMGNSGLTS